ncbi:MAG: DNA-3-methyladenine glycosylase 2 [Nitrosopumilaceae archaeon]
MLSSIELNVDSSINSGQVFLWEKHDNIWYGINGKDILSINESPFRIRSSGKTPDFFRKTDNLKKILNEISKDKIIKSAIDHSNGLRLLRQDPFQCYISFIVSSNSSIQNIKQTLQKLCKKFGKKIEFEKKEFFLFPEPEILSKASNIELQSCGLGYRAKFVKEASSAVSSGKIDFGKLKKMSYHDSKSALMEVFGIGNKVADCILLFSLEKLDAFPLDRWMLRILQKYYSDKFTIEGQTLTDKKYNELHEKIVSYFGPYAGYSQQFLFKMERDHNQKRWL